MPKEPDISEFAAVVRERGRQQARDLDKKTRSWSPQEIMKEDWSLETRADVGTDPRIPEPLVVIGLSDIQRLVAWGSRRVPPEDRDPDDPMQHFDKEEVDITGEFPELHERLTAASDALSNAHNRLDDTWSALDFSLDEAAGEPFREDLRANALEDLRDLIELAQGAIRILETGPTTDDEAEA